MLNKCRKQEVKLFIRVSSNALFEIRIRITFEVTGYCMRMNRLHKIIDVLCQIKRNYKQSTYETIPVSNRYISIVSQITFSGDKSIIKFC